MKEKRNVQAGMAPNLVVYHILKKYFFKQESAEQPIQLAEIRKKPVEERVQTARKSHDPAVIEMLAADLNRQVKAAARQNAYWKLLGQYKPLLKLPAKEKMELVRREVLTRLLVFVIYERDLKIRRELYLNPALSVHMLNSIRKFLAERGKPLESERHLKLIQSVIAIRRRRILQITDIFKQARQEDASDSLHKIFSYLLDPDEVVVRSAVSALRQVDFQEFKAFLTAIGPGREKEFDSEKLWLSLQKLKDCLNRQMNEKQSPEDAADEATLVLAFADAARQQQINLLEYCSGDLPDVRNLVTLAHAFLCEEPEIRKKLETILNIEELLALVNEPTFPHAVSNYILKILKAHPAARVRKRVQEIFLELNERTRMRLREMELSINAYFDIIFNSLGYPKIHQIRQAAKIMEAAQKLSGGFLNQFNGNKPDANLVNDLFHKISEHYRAQLHRVYLDVSEERIRELANIYEIILMVLNLPQDYLQKEGYEKAAPPEESGRVLERARVIWRFSLGQYLGRLHELDDMIRRKWLHLLNDKRERIDLHAEMNRVTDRMESGYKREVHCQLDTACKNCKRRPCASERFLRQVEFFLGELLDDVDYDDLSPAEAYPDAESFREAS